MTNNFDYVISGGQEGKDRLNILSAVMEPYTKNLLTGLGLRQGSYFLDNGAGGGNVALMVAGIVGSSGKVTGTDADNSILELAREDSKAKQLKNTSFLNIAIEDYDFKNEFDISYARFLLSHLKTPLQALIKMKEATKPGGIIVAEDIQFSGHFCYPNNSAFHKYLELYTAVVKQRGGNAELGPQLPGLFSDARIKAVQFDVIQPAFNTGSGKWMAYVTLDKIKESLISSGIATKKEIETVQQELKAFTEDANSIISLPRIFRVHGINK